MTVVFVVADSVTALGADARGAVLVSGSHGGLVAAQYASAAGVRAAIFNDAGRGLEDAGIAGVRALDGVGMAAAAVAHTTSRIADGGDTLARGIVSFANAHAVALGVAAGMPCRDAAERLCGGAMPAAALAIGRDARNVLDAGNAHATAIVGLDSIGSVHADDAGRVLDQRVRP